MKSNWEKIAAGISAKQSKKAIWKILRRFNEPDLSSPDLNWIIKDDWLWKVDCEHLCSDGKAIKLTMRSSHHHDLCETVLLRPTAKRFSVCVSTQIGCAVSCAFCATGKMGLKRNLSSWEIVEQFLRAGWAAKRFMGDARNPPPVRNVVFMGMGEPLHNPMAVEQAIAVLSDPSWFGLSLRSMTLSTAGVPTQMVAMAEQFPRLRIALSLHSADPQKRRNLVPKAIGDLEALRQTILQINAIQNDTVWIEITLIDGINDSERDASLLIDFCQGLNVEVNVIPYNDTSHATLATTLKLAASPLVLKAPSRNTVDSFIAKLRLNGIVTTYRNTLGQSIQAACGQLITTSSLPIEESC
jgi:23S rRNA (adenine2503-C2)-methyltransferase